MTSSQASLDPTGALAIDRSCRLPLMLLFTSAAIWLLLGSCFGLIASIKFHSPDFLAHSAWLTYGRVRPAYVNALLYGFSLQAGSGIALWLFARLGNAPLRGAVSVLIGGALLNLGTTVGVAGILAGDSSGFENLEMPGYSVPMVFIGYLLITIPGLITLRDRERRPLYVSQWFLLAALFWFPWIYCTAELLLVTFPVRGVAQAVIAWWYSQNLTEVWFGLVGLATAFYFVPVFAGRPLHSRYLALLVFWVLILFASWGGIPNSAPVPAWMPALSSASRVVTLIAVLAVALNLYRTLGRVALVSAGNPPFSFVLTSVAAFLLAALMAIGAVLWDRNQLLQFSWFAPARGQLHLYGFFVMSCLGGIYHIVPRLTGAAFPFGKLVRLHFWLAVAGLALTVLPLALGGFVQARAMADAGRPLVEVARATLPFLRAGTVGDLLLLAGHALLAINMIAMIAGIWRARVSRAYELATEDLFKRAEAKA